MKMQYVLYACLIFYGCTPRSDNHETKTDVKLVDEVSKNLDVGSDQNSDLVITENKLSVEEEISAFIQKYKGEVDFESHYILAHHEGVMIRHLDELSSGALEWINAFASDTNEADFSNLLLLTNLNELHIGGPQVNTLDVISEIPLERLTISFSSSLESISELNTNSNIKQLNISDTGVLFLPDMSSMTALTELFLENTPIKSLDNIETIPSSFFLYLRNCNDLTDIDALRFSNVSGILIDNKDVAPQWVDEGEEGTYNRFEDWFDKYLPEILERNPDFKIYFDIDDLYGYPM